MILAFNLFLWFIVIGVRIWMDRNGRKYQSYIPVNLALGICSILHGIFLDLEYREDVFGGGYIPWSYLLLLTWQCTSYWLFFEGGLNIVRKRIKQLGFWKGLLYFDTAENDSGYIDAWFAKKPFYVHTIAKVIALALFIGITFKYI